MRIWYNMQTMKCVCSIFALVLAFAAFAEKRPFERYQTIIDRHPFGQPPPGYNPEQFPSDASRQPAKTAEELSQEQQQLQKSVSLHAINIDPDGSVMVGFSDMSDPKSPTSYYMAVGETRNGWFVKEASPSATNAFMTVVKDSVEVTLKLGESTQASAAQAASNRGGRATNLSGPRSGLLRRPGAGSAPASFQGRRAKREQEEAEAKAAAVAREQEQKRRDEEAAAKAEADKAAREQERAEQRQQLMAIQEELRRAREEKQRQKEEEQQNEEGNNES